MRKSPVNRAIKAPRLSYGVSPKALGACWGPAAFLAVLLATSADWWFGLIPLAFAGIVHVVLKWAYSSDHHRFGIYIKFSLMANKYHPHPRERLPIHFDRPHKVGKGLRI